jgi:hypothetical protein
MQVCCLTVLLSSKTSYRLVACSSSTLGWASIPTTVVEQSGSIKDRVYGHYCAALMHPTNKLCQTAVDNQ